MAGTSEPEGQQDEGTQSLEAKERLEAPVSRDREGNTEEKEEEETEMLPIAAAELVGKCQVKP